MPSLTPDDLAADLQVGASAAAIRELTAFLTSQGTFHFPTLPTGLFSAAAGTGEDFDVTGYRSVWVRDNVHVAHALWLTDQPSAGIRAAEALMTYFIRHQRRFADVIEGRADPSDPMQRPHIRFNGDTLDELPEKWAHAQNDALGYFLWFYGLLVEQEAIRPAPAAWSVLADIAAYFRAIEYWHDEDSGHWEETRKIEASSIAAATAGLKQLQRLMNHPACEYALENYGRGTGRAAVDELIGLGDLALLSILPAECTQSDPRKRRDFDAALLFSIYPLEVVTEPLADQIVCDVAAHLQGPFGIRRYLGDSYWCADYKQLLSAEVRTADFSDDVSVRDKLLKPGDEAQWCLFDPIMSAIAGRRFLRTRDFTDRERQIQYLQRSLRQLTPADSRFGPYRCPESYYRENGQWVPNDITPLLWTQANLRLALYWAEATSEDSAET
uniref:Phosphorylase kinase n=1 Tax=Schlesneria paludicola TaxID=360056 RepID=A0A7C2NVJ5_9PLAN